jgi:hypothetical protein
MMHTDFINGGRVKTSSCKNKGRALQKYIAQKLTEIFELGEGDCVSRPMGSGGVDLMMSPLARSKFPISIESKNTKKFPSIEALRQSNANKYSDTIAGAVWKPPGKGMDDSIIYFNLGEFINFIKENVNE